MSFGSKLLKLTQEFYRLAVAPEVMKLRQKSNLWFGEQFSEANTDQYFAIFDKKKYKKYQR